MPFVKYFPIVVLVAVSAVLIGAGKSFAQSIPDTSTDRSQDTPVVAEVRIEGTLSDETVQLIATKALRSLAPRTRGPLRDLVRESCGYTSPNNERVFAAALLDQGARLDGDSFTLDAAATAVPPCLPDETLTRIVGRLPADGESFYTYFETDLGVRLPASADVQPRVRIDPQVQIDVAKVIAGHREFSRYDPSQDGLLVARAESVTRAREFLANSGLDPRDTSRVAYESFVATNQMYAAGVEPELSRNTIRESLSRLGVENTAIVLDRVEIARQNKQKEPLLRDLPIMADFCRDLSGVTAAFCAAPASGTPVSLPQNPTVRVITSLNSATRVPSASQIQSYVPVVSTEQVHKSAFVVLTSAEGLPPETPTRAATASEALTTAVGAVSDLTLFDNVASQNGLSCRGGSYRNWNNPEFEAAFRTALATAATRQASNPDGLNPTRVLVLDGGFLRLETDGFGAAPWSAIQSANVESRPDSLRGMSEEMRDKVIHGTTVAGLVMGGPSLMDSFAANGLDVRMIVRRAFRLVGTAEAPRFEAQRNLTRLVADTSPDIVNLSFAASDQNTGRLDLLRDQMLGRDGDLFIVAAGNNGNNDRSGGQLLTDIGLFPQFWGAGNTSDTGATQGFNLLVVAALDSDGASDSLAWFSNYDRDLVYLAAPGCNVQALSPDGAGGYGVQGFNGTSYAAPIVTYVAAALRSVMPVRYRSAPWVRARLLASADVNSGMHSLGQVNHGRILNPVAALRIHDDVVSLREPLEEGGPLELIGQLLDITADGDFDKTAVCHNAFNGQHSLLRLLSMPASNVADPPRWTADLMTEDDLFIPSSCNLKTQGTLRMRVDGREFPVLLDKVSDIRFALPRGD